MRCPHCGGRLAQEPGWWDIDIYRVCVNCGYGAPTSFLRNRYKKWWIKHTKKVGSVK